jgi:hypothetical protein
VVLETGLGTVWVVVVVTVVKLSFSALKIVPLKRETSRPPKGTKLTKRWRAARSLISYRESKRNGMRQGTGRSRDSHAIGDRRRERQRANAC